MRHRLPWIISTASDSCKDQEPQELWVTDTPSTEARVLSTEAGSSIPGNRIAQRRISCLLLRGGVERFARLIKRETGTQIVIRIDFNRLFLPFYGVAKVS